MEKYNIDGREWIIEGEHNLQIISKGWYCLDGTPATLIIEKDETGFNLHCFGGIELSNISVHISDFIKLWSRAFSVWDYTFGHTPDGKGAIEDYTYSEQCTILADYLCSIFCEWVDLQE